jgi:hypothetical protein
VEIVSVSLFNCLDRLHLIAMAKTYNEIVIINYLSSHKATGWLLSLSALKSAQKGDRNSSEEDGGIETLLEN